MNTRVTSFSNFHIAAACCQWIGDRDRQEDACCLHPAEESKQTESFLAILADGMGGVADGEKASNHLVDSFMCAYAGKCAGEIPTADTMARCLSYANQSLGDLKSDGRIDKDAGATFIALSISNDTMTWLNVGDSLLYRQQANTITKIKQVLKNLLFENGYLNRFHQSILQPVLLYPMLETAIRNNGDEYMLPAFNQFT